ncbi:DUF397 domain-containing protein [Actinokineospora sp.]|uniref:DUF397 domain-containing protein n=1 Tax=Actinokineospora sp. TaxID=1872133 RepID=UPI003D6ACDF7
MSRWHKSSLSGGDNNDCAELALTDRGGAIRDSKDPTGQVFTVPSGNADRS